MVNEKEIKKYLGEAFLKDYQFYVDSNWLFKCDVGKMPPKDAELYVKKFMKNWFHEKGKQKLTQLEFNFNFDK